ncbi:MAG: molybdopterin molybdotransferase MoeA [Acidimicrobiia bacterium]|nr:MAG: molybdopterin molybdotransferase MoeA [Acidimicrobiia bacterium]
MRALAEARRTVVEAMVPLPVISVPLAEAAGLVLASDVVAPHDVPPFPNSAVDGFAVRAVDLVSVPIELVVVEDLPAGRVASHRVLTGTAIRIMTGAPMPDGADSVVMVEDTEEQSGTVTIRRAVRTGENVRPAGGDLASGAVALEAGTRLGPAAMGVLATLGVTLPRVRRRPVVAVASTGDELLPSEAVTLRPGTIRDSNRPMLTALLHESGMEVRDLGIIPDDARLLRSTLEEAASTADAVVTTGGVSMGAHDLVKQVLGELGRVEFWKVAMQPAKPFAFGFLGETPFFGLPGNPVSVAVAFEQFLRPAMLRRLGAIRLFRPRMRAIAAEDLVTNPGKVVFVRVAIDDDGSVRPAGGQSSNVLSALAAADAFAVVPVGVGTVAVGEVVTVEMWRAAETRTLEEAEDD